MPRLSLYARQRIVVLATEYTYSYGRIRKELAKESIEVSISAIYRLLKKYRQTKTLEDAKRSGKPELLKDDQKKMIDQWLLRDDELSTTDLQKLLWKESGQFISRPTIQRAVKEKLNWICSKPRYCQMIRQKNKEKRLEFCKQLLGTGDNFHDVVFTDESTVQLARYYSKCRYKKDMPRPLKPKPKHPLKVHIWAGISMEGPTNIVIFTGNMDADFYIEILESALLPFLRDHPNIERFQQDNDPKHTSKKAAEMMRKTGINWWRTPAESPDLNPIEKVWAQLKRFLCRKVKPLTQAELVQGIERFWAEKMTPDLCTRYINHLHKVIPKVIDCEGGPTGE